jgi:Spy/CpxP family protein refolding chaperone
MMSNMMAELNLSTNQKAQIQALRQNNRGNHMQNREAMMNILTPEQRQKLATMRAQHMKQGGHMMKRGHMNQDGHMINKGHMNQEGHMNQ